MQVLLQAQCEIHDRLAPPRGPRARQSKFASPSELENERPVRNEPVTWLRCLLGDRQCWHVPKQCLPATLEISGHSETTENSGSVCEELLTSLDCMANIFEFAVSVTLVTESRPQALRSCRHGQRWPCDRCQKMGMSGMSRASQLLTISQKSLQTSPRHRSNQQVHNMIP